MEIRETSIPCHKRNLLEQRSRTPPVSHHVPRGKTIHVKHHSKRGNGTTPTLGEHLRDNLSGGKIFQKSSNSAGARIWKVFITFGSYSASIFAVFIIARLVKLIIDTIIHGYALHSFYGCGIHLLPAIWSSVTHLHLHPARPIITNQANQPEEQQPAKIFPTTEEPRPIPPFTSENQHPAHKVHHTFSIMDVVKSNNELRKILDRN